MSRAARSLSLATGATLALLAPAAAGATTGTLDRQCYSRIGGQVTQPIVVRLRGGIPGSNFLVAANGSRRAFGSAGSASGRYDAGGNAVAVIQNVAPPSGTSSPSRGQTLFLTVRDFGTGVPIDTKLGTTLVTNLAMKVANLPSSPRRPRRVAVSGTPFAAKRIYGFIVKGAGTRILRRFFLGVGNVCGYTTAKRIVAPRSFRRGTYRLYINAGPRLDKPRALAFSFAITPRRR